MIKLVKANLFRLKRSVIFWLCMAFSFISGIYFVIDKFIDLKKNPTYHEATGYQYCCPESVALAGGVILIFSVAVFIALYIGTDCTEGAVRNKMIVGYDRISIYLANLVTAAFVSLLHIVCFNGASFLLGELILPSGILTIAQISMLTLCECLAFVSLTSILTMFAMLIQNKSVSAVTIVMSTFIMLFAAAGIYSKAAYSVPGSDGIGYSIYQFLDNILPVDQIYQIAILKVNSAGIMSLYSVIMTAVSVTSGIVVFRRKDFK